MLYVLEMVKKNEIYNFLWGGGGVKMLDMVCILNEVRCLLFII